MGLFGWIWAVLIVIIVAFIIIGQPDDKDVLRWEVSPQVVKKGYTKVKDMGKAVVDIYSKNGVPEPAPAGETPSGDESKTPKESFALMGETSPPLDPRIDVFDTATIGSDMASSMHAKAFNIDLDNRLRSLRLSEPEVMRPWLAGNAFLYTGDYEGRKEVQANPFVKLSIFNPTEMTTLLPDRAM